MATLPVLDEVQAECILTKEAYDWEYCRHLALTKGVIGIPASPFLSAGTTTYKNTYMARFAFCKKDSTLVEASKRLSSKSSLLPSHV